MKYIDENKLDGLYDGIRCYMCTHLVTGYYRGCDGCCDVDGTMYGNVCHVIQEFLTNAKIEVEPVRHGHWVVHEYWHGANRDNATMGTCYKSHYVTCSMCGEREEEQKNYCPECGAKMDEEENDAKIC